MATFRAIAAGSRNSPPAPAIKLRLTSGIQKVAAVDATTRSQDKTISRPPASAGPSTAAINGLLRGYRTKPANPPLSVSICLPLLTDLRSAPALNTGPVAARIPTHASSSASKLSRCSSSSVETSWLIALRASGRFNLKRPIFPRFS